VDKLDAFLEGDDTALGLPENPTAGADAPDPPDPLDSFLEGEDRALARVLPRREKQPAPDPGMATATDPDQPFKVTADGTIVAKEQPDWQSGRHSSDFPNFDSGGEDSGPPPFTPLNEDERRAVAESYAQLKRQARGEQVRRIAERAETPKGFLEALGELSDNGLPVPLAGNLDSVNRAYDMVAIAERVREGSASDAEELALYERLVEEGRERTVGGMAVEILGQMPQFMTDLGAGAGLFRLGRAGTQAGINSSLRSLLGKSADRKLKKRLLTKGLIGAAGATGGATASAPVAGPGLAMERFWQEMRPEMEMRGETVEDFRIAVGESPDSGQAARRAIADSYIELLSERTGGAVPWLGRMVKPLRDRALKNAAGRAILRLNPKLQTSQLRTLVDTVGWNGVLGEMFEERAGDAMRAAVGLEEFEWPSRKQLAAELLAFSVPAAGAYAADRALRPPRPKPPEDRALDRERKAGTEREQPPKEQGPTVPLSQARSEQRERRVEREEDPERQRKMRELTALETEIEGLRKKGGDLLDGLSDQEYNRYKIARQMQEDLRTELRSPGAADPNVIEDQPPAPTDRDIADQLGGDLTEAGREKLRTQLEQRAEDQTDEEAVSRGAITPTDLEQRRIDRRKRVRQMGDKPIYKWTDEEVGELAGLGYVRARREQVRRDRDDYARRMEASAAAERQRRLSRRPFTQLEMPDLEFLADRGDEAAMSEIEQRIRREEYENQFDPKEELLEAIRSVGGLPHPEALKDKAKRSGRREPMLGELESLFESTADVRKQKSKKGKIYERRVQPRGLWNRKNPQSLDRIREVLQADYGFSWMLEPDDVLQAVDERVREGKKIFPDWAMGMRGEREGDVRFSRRGEVAFFRTDRSNETDQSDPSDTPTEPFQPGETPPRTTAAEVTEATADLREAWREAGVRVEIVQSARDLPPVFRRMVEGEPEGSIEGFYDKRGRTSYLIADNLDGTAQARSVLFHEVVGHHGMREILGERYQDFMRSVWRRARDRPEMSEIVEDYMLDPADPVDRIEAAEEYVARIAEGEATDPALWRRILAAVRDWLRRMGWADAEISEQDIRDALARARRELERPRKEGPRREPSSAPEPVAMSRRQAEDSPKARMESAVREIVDGADSATVKNLRPDVVALGGTADVTIPWGNEKMGLYHIGAKRGADTVRAVLDTVVDGEIDRYTAAKKTVTLRKGDVEAVLSLDESGESKTWLLTGWKKGEPDAVGEVGAQSDATQTEPTFSRSDLGAGSDEKNAQEGGNVNFSRKRFTADLHRLRRREAEYTEQIDRYKREGRKPPAGMLGERAELRARIADMMAEAEASVPNLSDGEPVADPQPARDEATPRRNRANSELEAATHAPETDIHMWWRQFKAIVTGFKDAIPELPKYRQWQGKMPQFFIKFREGHRYLIASTDEVRKQAQEDLAHIVEPIRALGREVVGSNDMRELQTLVKRRSKRREAGAKVPASLNARIEALEEKLADNPFYLFQTAIIYRDLWYRSLMTNSDGKPLKLPGGLQPEDVRRRLGDIHGLIAENKHSAEIGLALKRHYKLVEELQQDLLDHGQIIPEDLRNPLYYPHHVIENFSGKLGRVQPLPSEPFRGYLIDPVGSSKSIEADYLKAIYHHVVQVRAHNAQQDLVEEYWKPYDISEKVQAELEAEAAEEGRRAHADEWKNPNNHPAGYRLYTVDDTLPLRMEYMIDRDMLAEQLGVAFGDGDLRKRMKELGVEADITPEMLRTALTAGEKKQWLVPEPVAEALQAIKERQKIRNSAIFRMGSGILGFPLRMWKYNILFAPWNYIRYEFNNTLADLEKVLALEPGLFKTLQPAAQELRAFWNGKAEPSVELREAFKRGVIDSVTVQESGQLKQFDEFAEFLTSGELTRNNVRKWATRTTDVARLRESTFRYAKFQADVDRMRGGAAPVYGGAYHKDVEAREGIYAKAAYISQRTFGDYSNLSLTGQTLREQMIPFYSWMEINFRYHANLLRNTFDMLRATRWSEAMTHAEMQGKAAAATVMGVWVRLMMPYLAIQLWNNFGGQMVGLWDEDDDLESQLSEHDRRRLHIILGRDANGKIRVVHTPTALSDIMEWFGGNRLGNLFTDYAAQRISFDQMVSDYGKTLVPDLMNKVVQGFRPDLKGAYMGVSRKNPFPDIFDQRTISEHDLWWNILSTTTDRSASLALRSLLDEEYYSPKSFPEWAQQAILQIRRRDPEQWAYYEIRDKTAEWLEETQGKARGGFDYNSPDQQAIRNFRKAIYNADIGAAIKFYNLLLDYGYTAERFQSSVRAQDPLSGLSKDDRRAWYATLTDHERQQVELAMRYYSRIAQSKGSEKILFPREGQRQFTPRYSELVNILTQSMLQTDQQRKAFAEQLLGRSLR